MTIGSPVVIPTPTTSIPTVNEVFVPVVEFPAFVQQQPRHWVWFAGGWQRVR